MGIQTYEPSGKFNPLVFLIVPGLGLAGGLIGGWIYQALIDYIPYIILGALFTLFFGVGLGVLVGFGLKWGKCRNLGMAIGLGVCVGIIGLVASYYWAYQRVESDVMSDPMLVEEVGGNFSFGDYVDARVEFGWQVGGRDSSGEGTSWSGGLVYVIWLIEAIMIVGVAGAAPLVFASRPYCEDCDCWANNEVLGEVHGVDMNRIKAAAKAEDINNLIRPIGNPQSNHWLTYTLWSCPGEGHPNWLTVELKWEEGSGKKVETKDEDMLQYGVIEPEMIDVVRQSVANGARVPEKFAKSGAQLPQGKATPQTGPRPAGKPRPPQAGPRPPAKAGAPRPPLPKRRPPQS